MVWENKIRRKIQGEWIKDISCGWWKQNAKASQRLSDKSRLSGVRSTGWWRSCLLYTSKDISAGDILRTLEGDLTPIDCAAFTGDTSTCSGTKFCVTKTVWQRINDSVQQAVDSITLQELMEESIEIHTKYDQEER